MEKIEDYEGGVIYVIDKGKRGELFVWIKNNVAYGPYVSLEIARETVKTYVSNPGGGGVTDYNQLTNKPNLNLKADKTYVDAQDTVLTKKIGTGLDGKVNKSGDTMTGELIVPSLDVNGSKYIAGSGFPNGTITAPVGALYVDKAMTNGAFLWAKKTGAGNTGWVVVDGDTGWRNITSLIKNGWGPHLSDRSIFVRRVNSDVYLNIDGIKSDATTSEVLVTLPLGLRASMAGGNARFLLHSINTNPTQVHRGYIVVGDVYVNGTNGRRLDIFGSFRFTTDDAWPTTLPGAAA